MKSKELIYEARKLAERKEMTMEEAMAEILGHPNLTSPDQFIECPACGVEVKGLNFKEHNKKHLKVSKIKWNKIPLIAKQKAEKKKLSKAAGKQKVKIVSGGAPNLGKRK